MSKRLYRTVIIVYTDEHTMVDGDEWELETIAREAVEGGAICASQTCQQVQAGDVIPEGVLEFFNLDAVDTSEPELDDDSDWRSEMAMQAGMMGGCDAYNEAIGSPTGRPAGSRYDNYDNDEEN